MTVVETGVLATRQRHYLVAKLTGQGVGRRTSLIAVQHPGTIFDVVPTFQALNLPSAELEKLRRFRYSDPARRRVL